MARLVAFQALYESDVSGHPAAPATRRLAEAIRLRRADAEFAVRLAAEVESRREDLDHEIRRFAPAWPVEQIATVDRNLLRMALVELSQPEGAPRRAVVNEAVELAKVFGAEGSQRFVNGALGKVLG